MKFAKLDVMRYPELAKQFRISNLAWEKMLPTIIAFENGEKTIQRPEYLRNNKLELFKVTLENVEHAFKLAELYDDCRKSWGNRARGKGKELKKEE